jgi:hypothetical protein
MANGAFIIFVLTGIIALYGLARDVRALIVLPWLVVLYRIYSYCGKRKRREEDLWD